MERFNVPIPPDDDFPQVIRAQKNGEDFKKEFVDYVPRWNVNERGQAVIVDKSMFFALTSEVDRLQEYNAKLRETALWTYRVMNESCATRYSYSPESVSMLELTRIRMALKALGIEVE